MPLTSFALTAETQCNTRLPARCVQTHAKTCEFDHDDDDDDIEVVVLYFCFSEKHTTEVFNIETCFH